MSLSIHDIFSTDGPIARIVGDAYESRGQQVRMSEAVERAMEQRGRLLVEAGTGVGKSFAYLAPAMLRAAESGERVVIATNTIALQEQLLKKDVPLLRRALDLDEETLRVALVKGRGNYLSVRRLELASKRKDRIFAGDASLRSLHVIEDWAYSTEDGTLSTLPQLERPGVWERVQSDSGNCMGRRCPRYEQCFYQAARKEMEQANLLICNHAIFFADLALRRAEVGFIPPYEHVVLDEAHAAEDVASDYFGATVSEGAVRSLLGTLHHARRHKGFIDQLVLQDGDTEAIDQTIRLTLDAQDAADRFFQSVVDLVERQGSGADQTVRVPEAATFENPLTPKLKELGIRLKRLRERVQFEEDRFELNAYAERAAMLAASAEALVDQSIEGCVYWAEAGSRSARRRRVRLACSPIDVAPILREALFGQEASVTLTSATMTTGADSFDHISSRLGCDDAESLAVGSPFDHASQAELLVDETMPDPRHQAYPEELARRIVRSIEETDGGAFVLFTSLATMRAAADRVEEPLRQAMHPLLVQGRDGDRAALVERFLEDDRSVLFGVSTFWQGVDVRGRNLRNVIITRLPFEPPGRPLTEARLERVQEQGGHPFMDDSLPRAVIRFKQGFGRLIRSAEDFGRVVVLDPRIVTKPYGKRFIRALPEGLPIVRMSGEQSDEASSS